MNTIDSIINITFPHKLFLNIKYFKIEKIPPTNMLNFFNPFFESYFIDAANFISIDLIINSNTSYKLFMVDRASSYRFIIE